MVQERKLRQVIVTRDFYFYQQKMHGQSSYIPCVSKIMFCDPDSDCIQAEEVIEEEGLGLSEVNTLQMLSTFIRKRLDVSSSDDSEFPAQLLLGSLHQTHIVLARRSGCMKLTCRQHKLYCLYGAAEHW